MTDTRQQRPPAPYTPPPLGLGEWLGFLFGLLGMVIGPAAVGGLFYLCEGGYHDMASVLMSLLCIAVVGGIGGIVGGYWVGKKLGSKISRRAR
jgi:hypothetical protein